MLKLGCQHVGGPLPETTGSQRVRTWRDSHFLRDSVAHRLHRVDEKIKLRRVKWIPQSHQASWCVKRDFEPIFCWLWVSIASCPATTHGFLRSLLALLSTANPVCCLFWQISFTEAQSCSFIYLYPLYRGRAAAAETPWLQSLKYWLCVPTRRSLPHPAVYQA